MTTTDHDPRTVTDAEVTTPAGPKRVLSGMRPTGKLHLGNYMGALHNWVRLQNELEPPAVGSKTGRSKYDCYFFIADYHALTTDYADPRMVKQNTFDVALDWLAAGLDPEQSTIFVQSHVPQHAELHLLLSMITPLGWLERVPSYKDQQENLSEKDLSTYGFLGYPLLQSADILLYAADFVPVGQDQVAHVELTREVARRFNHMYAPKRTIEGVGWGSSGLRYPSEPDPDRAILPEPQVLLTPSPKLPGTDGRKMSKSYGNTILLTDSAETIAEKTKNMYNGGQRDHVTQAGDPDICPVADLHKIFSNPSIDADIRYDCRTARISCINCKHLLTNSIIRTLYPLQDRRSQFELRPSDTWDLLVEGAKKAAVRAQKTMLEVKEAMGLAESMAGIDRFPFTVMDHIKQAQGVQYDLRNHSALWNESSERRGHELRDIWWKKMAPYAAALKRSEERLFITQRNKRVFVTTSREDIPNQWNFVLRNKSYEVVVLLCWAKSYLLIDLVLPQKIYRAAWNAISKSEKEIAVSVQKIEESYLLHFPGQEPADVTSYVGNYEPLG